MIVIVYYLKVVFQFEGRGNLNRVQGFIKLNRYRVEFRKVKVDRICEVKYWRMELY